MSLMVSCSKGCGVSISVSDEMIKEAQTHGSPLNVAHEICPRDQKVQPTYRAFLVVHRTDPEDDDTTELVSLEAEVVAPTFPDGFSDLSRKIEDMWTRAGQMRHIVEQDLHRTSTTNSTREDSNGDDEASTQGVE